MQAGISFGKKLSNYAPQSRKERKGDQEWWKKKTGNAEKYNIKKKKSHRDTKTQRIMTENEIGKVVVDSAIADHNVLGSRRIYLLKTKKILSQSR